jgi:hypothetical protein
MFDFEKWREWLETKGLALKAEGDEVRFASDMDTDRKPGMILEISDGKNYGGFECWFTGECDYTVMPYSERPKPRFYKWGLKLTDETFEAVFQEFMDHYLSLKSA